VTQVAGSHTSEGPALAAVNVLVVLSPSQKDAVVEKSVIEYEAKGAPLEKVKLEG